jgi:uncharacterized membrane protein
MNQLTQRDSPPLDMLRSTWTPYTDNVLVGLCLPAVLVYVPTIVVILPTLLIIALIGGIAAFTKPEALFALWPVLLIGMIAFAALYNFIRVGWTKIALDIARGGHPPFAEFGKGTPRFVDFLIVNFIIGIATFIGGLFFVVPGIFIAVRTALAPYLVVDQNLGPIEALKESNRLVTGYSWQTFLYYILLTVCHFVAGLVPLVQVVLPLAVMGYFDVALAKIYLMRSDRAVNAQLPDGLH